MDKNERNLHAQQHKDRVDLTTQHAKAWDKFQKRKEDYKQKYGATYADVLLQQERETLEAEFNQEIGDLAQHHDDQWLNYHESPSSDKPHNLPSFLKEPEPTKEMVDPDIQGKQVHQPVTGQSRNSFFVNPLKQRGKETNQIATSQTKDLDRSQDYMNAMLATQKSNPTKEKEFENDKKTASISARFSQGLSYTRAAEQPGRLIERNKDMDRD